ncbi:MAG: hypothetical protein AAB902_01830 [Patescibacteria group bacterium]
MILQKIKKNKGFVILFVVTLSSILLAIALGAANIALKEIKFGTSAKDTNNAFFAADSGAELALFNDKTLGYYPIGTTNFVVSGLGSSGLSCANVSVVKDDTTSPPSIITTVVSKGYNIGDAACLSSNPDRIEREIIVSY